MLIKSRIKVIGIITVMIISGFFNPYINSQNLHKLDSLNKLINKNVHDTLKIKAMSSIAEEYWYCKTDTVKILAEQIIDKAKKINYQDGLYYGYNNLAAYCLIKNNFDDALACYMKNEKICRNTGNSKNLATTLNNLGLAYTYKGDYVLANEYYLTAIEIFEKLQDKTGLARSYNNLGLIFYHRSLFPIALELFFKSLRIKEQLDDETGKISSLNNIANIYFKTKNFKSAIEYYTQSLELRIRLNDRYGIADSYSNLATTYENMQNYDLAMSFYGQAEKTYTELGDKMSLGSCYNNIGYLYTSTKDYKKAMEYFTSAIKIREEIKDKAGLAMTYINTGKLYYKTGELNKAMEYLVKGLEIAEETNGQIVTEAHLYLSELYEKKGNLRLSLDHMKKQMELENKIFNEDSMSKILQTDMKFDYEKKILTDSLKRENAKYLDNLKEQQENLKKEEKFKRQQIYIYSGIGGILLLFFIAVVLLRSNRMKVRTNLVIREQKREVENQKIIVENKNKEITDSINYARRIQKAIIPSDDKLVELFNNIFVLYRPKDIVAGDFYWVEKKNGRTFIAAVDCTGHGVPGAMVSVVGFNGLNYAVNELNLTSPSDILEALNQFVEKTFGKGKEDINDGMDIAICSIDFSMNIIEFAGANNPAWFINNKTLQNIPCNKQPVGKFRDRTPFNSRSFSFSPGDYIYLFTDGLADQFGGPYGKKFKYSRLRELIMKINDLPLSEQGQILENEFLKWKGHLEQVDDILIIGMKL